MRWRPSPETIELARARDRARRQAARSAKEPRVSSQRSPLFFLSDGALDRRVAGFAGANSVNVLEVHDEDLAVADLAGLRSGDDRLDDSVRELVANGNLYLHLRKEIDHVLRATVQLGVAALATKPLHFGDRHSLDTHVRERVADVVQAKRLDDCGYQL